MLNELSMLEDEELVKRATRAYLARCRREGWIELQPGRTSHVDRGVVVLENSGGELARYKVTGRGLCFVGSAR